jgi:DNA-binding transcriptional MerR regulator
MRSGELARRAGVSADTLRHYERKGLLPAPKRTPGGYRVYNTESLQRVLLIRRALAFGFSLGELAEVLAVRDRGGAPCRRVRLLASEKLSSIGTHLRELRHLRDSMRELITDWDRRLATNHGQARLLETLPAVASKYHAIPSGPISSERRNRYDQAYGYRCKHTPAGCFFNGAA